MNTRARLARIEKLVGSLKIEGINPRRVEALARYLETGDAAGIPAGATFPELQEAARRIPKTARAARFPGLAALGAALGPDTLKRRTVLAYIEAGNPYAERAFYLEDEDPRPEWPKAEEELLRRLGIVVFLIDHVIKTPAHEYPNAN